MRARLWGEEEEEEECGDWARGEKGSLGACGRPSGGESREGSASGSGSGSGSDCCSGMRGFGTTNGDEVAGEAARRICMEEEGEAERVCRFCFGGEGTRHNLIPCHALPGLPPPCSAVQRFMLSPVFAWAAGRPDGGIFGWLHESMSA